MIVLDSEVPVCFGIYLHVGVRVEAVHASFVYRFHFGRITTKPFVGEGIAGPRLAVLVIPMASIVCGCGADTARQ